MVNKQIVRCWPLSGNKINADKNKDIFSIHQVDKYQNISYPVEYGKDQALTTILRGLINPNYFTISMIFFLKKGRFFGYTKTQVFLVCVGFIQNLLLLLLLLENES